MISYDQTIEIPAWVYYVIAACFIAIFATAIYSIVYADDTEDDLGLCYRGYKDHCENQKFLHDLEGRLMIWNSLNCSVRDICNSNSTVWNCAEDDETYNITGICDPDDNDTGIEDQALEIKAPVGWACFDTKALADKFLKIPGNEGYNVTWPCPKEVRINPGQEDQSGK